jgi:hypothetical protein
MRCELGVVLKEWIDKWIFSWNQENESAIGGGDWMKSFVAAYASLVTLVELPEVSRSGPTTDKIMGCLFPP